jgi:hypothetical protein
MGTANNSAVVELFQGRQNDESADGEKPWPYNGAMPAFDAGSDQPTDQGM